MLGEICLAIEMGANAEDVALTIHAHPTLNESIGMAAEIFEGTITELAEELALEKYGVSCQFLIVNRSSPPGDSTYY